VTASAGVAPNKFLAKVASDWNKPDGVFTIAPDQVSEFVLGLPVSKINGVGRVTTAKLQKMGVETCGDLQEIPLSDLLKRFGKYGKRLSEVARGEDTRAVQSSRVRKSISVEHTFAEDIADLPGVIEAMDTIVAELEQRFKKIDDRYYPTKRVVKIKYRDFTQTTLEEGISASGESWCSYPQFRRLMTAAWPRGAKPVRLLGVGLRLVPLGLEQVDQLSLFD
jgi:DNA polymerase-4